MRNDKNVPCVKWKLPNHLSVKRWSIECTHCWCVNI